MSWPVAFYAPLKSPAHPTPSGDRTIARLMIQALTKAGAEVQLASHLRSRDGKGNSQRQERLKQVFEHYAARLIRRYQALPEPARPRLWFTYHHYHKAPDWLGPRVAQALSIPYVIAEASWSVRQQQGLWHFNWQHSRKALTHADCLLCLNPKDQAGLTQLLGNSAPLQALPPFMDMSHIAPLEPSVLAARPAQREALASAHGLDPACPWLISVAMMRPGDKEASYHLLAEALRQCRSPYTLITIGDGEARAAVAEAFAGLPVLFLGKADTPTIERWLQAADLFVWPGVNEAFGMALLEAQAQGCPVIAGDEGGISNILAPVGSALVPKRDAQALASAIDERLRAPDALTALRPKVQSYTLNRHSLEAASQSLQQLLTRLIRPAPLTREPLSQETSSRETP